MLGRVLANGLETGLSLVVRIENQTLSEFLRRTFWDTRLKHQPANFRF